MTIAGSFLTFLAIATVVLVTPGQDTALTIRNTLVGGRLGGVMTALGVAAGQAVWALATAFGVVAFVVSFGPVFAAVKIAGACYIMFLGAQALYAALRPAAADTNAAGNSGLSRITPFAGLCQGIASNLGNPKMAVFFASLLPQFAPQGRSAFAVLALLGLICCAMSFLWLTTYAVVVASAGNILRRPKVRRTLEGVSGVTLFGLGLHIVATSR